MADFDPSVAPEVLQIRSDESPSINWEFANWLASGITITSLDSVTITPPGSLAVSGLGQSGTTAIATITADTGTDAVDYVLRAKVTTSDSQVLSLGARVEVRGG